jgi:hypothetical protein
VRLIFVGLVQLECIYEVVVPSEVKSGELWFELEVQGIRLFRVHWIGWITRQLANGLDTISDLWPGIRSDVPLPTILHGCSILRQQTEPMIWRLWTKVWNDVIVGEAEKIELAFV